MRAMHFRRSRVMHLGYLALALVMVGACYLTAVKAPDPFSRGVGWLGVVFFSAAAVPIVRGLLQGGIALTFDAAGITDYRLGIGTVPWTEVSGGYIVSVNRQRFICLVLRNPEMFLHALPPWRRVFVTANRARGFGDLTIGFFGLTPPITEAIAFLEELSLPSSRGNGAAYTDMNAQFQLAQGVKVTDLSGIEEGYSVGLVPAGYHVFTVNVSAENIPKVFRRLAVQVVEPAFLLFELPTRRDVEEQLRQNPSDPFHVDVYHLDGITWPVAEGVFTSYEFLLTHDGMVNFGFASHTGHDEVFVGAYKVFYIYADDPQKYHSALQELAYQEVPQIKTVWETFSQQSAGEREALTNANPTIWQMVEQLKEKGLYFAGRRED